MTAQPPGPESAAHNITAMRGRIHGIADAIAHGDSVHLDALRLALDALIAAVRHHDAEIVRALGPETMVGQYARDTIAERLEPQEGP